MKNRPSPLCFAILRNDIDDVVEPKTYPNGRFARLHDPEGNPIQLWEPSPK